jgi:hypothetical protein
LISTSFMIFDISARFKIVDVLANPQIEKKILLRYSNIS